MGRSTLAPHCTEFDRLVATSGSYLGVCDLNRGSEAGDSKRSLGNLTQNFGL